VSEALDDREGVNAALPHPAARHDWPAQAADQVVNVVDTVRQKTTGPALTVARAVVYGLVILITAVAALVLFIAALVRFLDYWFPLWAVYLGLGLLFVLVGGLLYRLRASKAPAGNQSTSARG
jgi:hypothetical protein